MRSLLGAGTACVAILLCGGAVTAGPEATLDTCRRIATDELVRVAESGFDLGLPLAEIPLQAALDDMARAAAAVASIHILDVRGRILFAAGALAPAKGEQAPAEWLPALHDLAAGRPAQTSGLERLVPLRNAFDRVEGAVVLRCDHARMPSASRAPTLNPTEFGLFFILSAICLYLLVSVMLSRSLLHSLGRAGLFGMTAIFGAKSCDGDAERANQE